MNNITGNRQKNDALGKNYKLIKYMKLNQKIEILLELD